MTRCVNCKLETNATIKAGGFSFCFSCYDRILYGIEIMEMNKDVIIKSIKEVKEVLFDDKMHELR